VTSPITRIASPGPGTAAARRSRAGAEPFAERSDLVLEQPPQRFDQLELEVVRQAADVVVGLDVRGAGAATGLHDIRVQRALDQVVHRFTVLAGRGHHVPGRLLEDPDELPADDLGFCSGSVTPASAVRNRSAASTTCNRTPVAATKSVATCSASPARSSP
jgi:hypothetical protein